MRRLSVFALAILLSGLALPAVAQSDAGNVTFVVRVWPEAHAGGKFEDAVKKHMAWHRDQKDPWSWLMFQVITGPDGGAYVAGTFDHDWKDWDGREEFEAADHAHVESVLDPVIGTSTSGFYVRMPFISRPVESEQPLPLYELYHYKVKMGKEESFTHVIGKIHKAIVQLDMPWHYNFYALMNGGEHPTFVLSIAHPDFDDFKMPEKNVKVILREVYGETEADSLMEQWGDTVESVRSEILRFRPDLSYVAGGN